MKYCLFGGGCFFSLVLGAVIFWFWFYLFSRNMDLPHKARKYKGAANNRLLGQIHKERIQFYRDHGITLSLKPNTFDPLRGISSSRDWGDEAKQCPALFKNRRPHVDNFDWHQAFAIPTKGDGNFILLYESWPIHGGGERSYLLCTLGEVSEKEINQVVEFLDSEFMKMMREKEARLRLTKP